jgi:5-methylcytosine-specific restriction endonuclease McrA
LLFSITDLKKHLEKQFDKYMSWNNYGKYWHIDHIIPHSLFQYTSMEDQSFKDCWALNNLRPLEAKQNLSDGGSRIRHKK